MFEVGYGFAARRVRSLGRSVGIVSFAGVSAPLLLGVALILLAGWTGARTIAPAGRSVDKA